MMCDIIVVQLKHYSSTILFDFYNDRFLIILRKIWHFSIIISKFSIWLIRYEINIYSKCCLLLPQYFRQFDYGFFRIDNTRWIIGRIDDYRFSFRGNLFFKFLKIRLKINRIRGYNYQFTVIVRHIVFVFSKKGCERNDFILWVKQRFENDV